MYRLQECTDKQIMQNTMCQCNQVTMLETLLYRYRTEILQCKIQVEERTSALKIL